MARYTLSELFKRPNFNNLTGRRFGKIIVLEYSHSGPGAVWKCRCDCGKEWTVRSGDLLAGKTVGCGRHKHSGAESVKTTHGKSASPEYKIWQLMRDRCTNPKSNNFHNYGGRGITYDPSWSSFEQFYSDMGPRPSSNLTLERIDNNTGRTDEKHEEQSFHNRFRRNKNNHRLGKRKRSHYLLHLAQDFERSFS
jgi:hypothetical protein